jgi:protein-S-isoprenylcysteine O-methyltransferase Ste14
MRALQLIGACWMAFVAYWIVSAQSVKPTAERQGIGAQVSHLALLAVGATLLAGLWRSDPLDMRVMSRGLATDICGVVLCLLGLVVAIWARRTLAGNWSSSVNLKQGHELIQRGPYGYVRHPIYSGLLLMFLGTAVAIGRLDAWLGTLVCALGFWIKLRQEEALMMRHFPDAYRSYRRNVKALVPFVF